jgi:predicted nucleotidyltransferase
MLINSLSLRLHNEIVELTNLLQPTEKEDEQRREAHSKVQEVVRAVFPGCTLDIFGSFATGLHLPTSDVDCVIMGSDVQEHQIGTALQGLGRALQQQEWTTDLEVRHHLALSGYWHCDYCQPAWKSFAAAGFACKWSSKCTGITATARWISSTSKHCSQTVLHLTNCESQS